MAEEYKTDEQQVQEWIETLTGVQWTEKKFFQNVRDGVALCNLMNKLSPGSVKKISNAKTTFAALDNIHGFLDAALAYGCKPVDLFGGADFIHRADPSLAVRAVMAIGREAWKHDWPGPHLVPKPADCYERHFDPVQVKKGKTTIGLQAGSFKGANQAGMSYGALRNNTIQTGSADVSRFDKDRVAETRALVALQAGSNTGASQKGMGFGMPRNNTIESEDSTNPYLRMFDLDTLAEGRKIIGLQAGYTKGANQKGMSFGKPRNNTIEMRDPTNPNLRQFSSDVIAEGNKVMSSQTSGYSKGENQHGLSFGKPRHIITEMKDSNDANRRTFAPDVVAEGNKVMSSQTSGYSKGETQHGLSFGKPRHIITDMKDTNDANRRKFAPEVLAEANKVMSAQTSGYSKGDSQKGVRIGMPRRIVIGK